MKSTIIKTYFQICLLVSLLLLCFANGNPQTESCRFYADNLSDDSWTQVGFEDTGWQDIRPGRIPADKWGGIGLFRYIVTVDSADRKKPLLLHLYARGAVEVFLDGNLLIKSGSVSDDSRGTQPDSMLLLEPVIFAPDSGAKTAVARHVIAIRYSNKHFRKTRWENYLPALFLHISDAESVYQGQLHFVKGVTANQFMLVGVSFAFALLHLLLYLFYPEIKSNLYYSIVTVLAATNIYFELNLSVALTFDELFFTMQMARISFVLFTPALMRFMYSIIYSKLPIQFYGFLLAAIILSFWVWWQPFALDNILYPFMLAAVLEILRAFIFTRQKPNVIRGARIIALGAGIFIFSASFQLLMSLGVFPKLWSFTNFPLPFYGMFCFMISMSIFLARHVAQTNKNLVFQLEQVKTLSEQALAQERAAKKAAIERERLEAENARKTKELEQARNLQLSMLPKKLPDHDRWEIEVYMETATEVGGDYYDFYLDKNGVLTATVGDATGHGLQAGIMVAATKSLFNAFLQHSDLRHILKQTSLALKKMGFRGMFMAATIAKFYDKEIRLVAAGMPFTLVYRAKTQTVEPIMIKAMPLGNFPDFPYREKNISVESGDTVLFMSDGLPEMFNNDGEMLGEEPIVERFRETGDKSAEEIVAALAGLGKDWASGHPQDDDVTLMVIKAK